MGICQKGSQKGKIAGTSLKKKGDMMFLNVRNNLAQLVRKNVFRDVCAIVDGNKNWCLKNMASESLLAKAGLC